MGGAWPSDPGVDGVQGPTFKNCCDLFWQKDQTVNPLKDWFQNKDISFENLEGLVSSSFFSSQVHKSIEMSQ